jgi:hypothetical protein
MVFSILYQIIIVLSILSIFTLSLVNVFATETNPINATNDFSTDLKSKINNLMSKALNDTGSVLNSSMLSNETNLTSSQVVISNNNIMSSMSSNGSGSDNSTIKNEIKTINGVCTSTKVGGNGDDTLASTGNCNDELTGGPGSDKFTCGEGDDTIKDYNSKEGDVILDRQNCEKIL